MTDQSQQFAAPFVLSGDAPDAVAVAAAALRSGKILALPTDTVYGLAAAVDRPVAINRLFTMKRRAESKAIPVLLDVMANAGIVSASFPPLAVILAERFWPGPLTIVVPARFHLPRPLTNTDANGRTTVAIRVPDHALVRRVIAAAGGAVAVTSANLSGQRESLDATSAATIGDESPDLVVDGGPAPGGTPSTIVLATGSEPILVREGAIPFADILASLRLAGRSSSATPDGS